MEKPNDLKDSIEPVNIESTTRILENDFKIKTILFF